MTRLSIFKAKEMAMPAAPADIPQAVGENLESVLLDLAKWGKPRVSMVNSRGWFASVEVNITPTGAKFDVSSEFGMATPLAAVLQCRERLMASVKAIGGAA